MVTSTSKHSRATSAGSSTDSVEALGTEQLEGEKAQDDSSKLRVFLGILRKFIGVSDIASVRFSLPSQLLEPIPNLEYWHYLDRPETFISIGDSEDELGRMLAALRFWFTKDLKYVKGKPCKPYNSTLGEFFRCTWDVEDTAPPVLGEASQVHEPSDSKKPVRLAFLTEQTSHHPPVSAYMIDCPEKGITARGYDQLSAKFTGTSIRVTPGSYNEGIFVTLKNRGDEEYQFTHPAAYLGGLIKGSLSVSVADICFVACPKTKLKTLLHYVEEGWLGRSQHKIIGVIYRYDPATDQVSKLKDVPEKDVVARIEGCWKEKISFTTPGQEKPTLLIDLEPLYPIPKSVPPEADQLPNESLRFWSAVTRAIHAKQWSQATRLKQELEEKQRERTARRNERHETWTPRFFVGAVTPPGRPQLTHEGIEVLTNMQAGNFHLDENTDVAT